MTTDLLPHFNVCSRCGQLGADALGNDGYYHAGGCTPKVIKDMEFTPIAPEKRNFMERGGLVVRELPNARHTCGWIPSLTLDGERCGQVALFCVYDAASDSGVPICTEHVAAAKATIAKRDGDPAAAFRAARDLRKKLAWNKRNKLG